MLELVAEKEKRQFFLPLIVIINYFFCNNILNHRELEKAKAQFKKQKPPTRYQNQNLMLESEENLLKTIVIFGCVINL